jgi:hypothetical protein
VLTTFLAESAACASAWCAWDGWTGFCWQEVTTLAPNMRVAAIAKIKVFFLIVLKF